MLKNGLKNTTIQQKLFFHRKGEARLKNNDFHDACIDNISYDGNTLKFHISAVPSQNKEVGYMLQTKVEEYDVRFCYVKMQPRGDKINFKVKEIDIKFVAKLFLRGRKLKIVDAFYATYQNRFMLECDIFPYSANSGFLNKMYIEVLDFNDFDIIPDNTKVVDLQ